MRPRRLLMTTDAVGGVWRYSVDLAGALQSLGVETVLLGFGPRPEAGQVAEAERVAQLRWADLPLDWGARDAAELDRVPDAIGRCAAAHAADLVQVNAPSQAAGPDLGVPVVAVTHSCVASWFQVVRGTDLPAEWQWQRRLTCDGMRAAARVVAPSHAHARLISLCYPGIGAIDVVPNATTIGTSADARQPYAYAAARWWDDGKNAATLDAAAGRLRFPVYAAGSTVGPEGQRQRFRHARHLGQLVPERLFDLAGSAAAFVSPSRYEPFGLAALEAARIGAALVLSDIPTYREIWDGAALFADPDDPAAFAEALQTVLDDTGRRDDLARRAAARSAEYSARAQAERMLDLYCHAVPHPAEARAI